mgnify:CR=1 FL=1
MHYQNCRLLDILTKMIETIYNQDLLERRMERMKRMIRRQFVNSGGFVHYQNCRLLDILTKINWNDI